MLELLEKLEDHYDDGIMCDSETQKEQIWAIREGISSAASKYGMVSRHEKTIYDVSVLI